MTSPSPSPGITAARAAAASGVMRGAAVAIVCGLLALTAWQYAMPPTFDSSWRLNHLSIEVFRGALGLPSFFVGDATYRWGFRGLLLVVWAGYFVLVFAGAAGGGRLPWRPSLAATAGLALALAVLWPSSLSTDVYGYVGYGRLQVIHHANPYLTGQEALVDLGDPTAPFLRWGIRSPYGPLWTWFCAAVIGVLGSAPLFAQVVAMKLIAGAAVVATACAGRALAERLQPGRGELALAAIGLNPLFLLEGAGNGHNDLVMMAFVLGGLALVARGRHVTGGLSVGLAAALKFIPLLLVPWLAAHALRAGGSAGRGRPSARDAGVAALVLLVGVAPLLLAFAPLWVGGATLDGLRDRWARGSLQEAHAGGGLLAVAGKNALAVAGYLAASAWVLARRDAGRLVTGWIVAASAVLFVSTGVWLPWYLAWPWSAALARWDARHLAASYVLFCFAVVFTLRYSVVLGG